MPPKVHDMSLPSETYPGLRMVAWHGGGAQTLRVGKLHLALEGATDGTMVRQTLCGRTWRRSVEVTPNDYWTTGECQWCVVAAEKLKS
jgi:hypothetical protein